LDNDDDLSFQSFQLLFSVVFSVFSSLSCFFSGLAFYIMDNPAIGVIAIKGVGAKVRSLSAYSSIILSECKTTALRPWG
jgi:hypothetical protein